MVYQKRKSVLMRTKYSWDSLFDGCSSINDEITAREIEARDEERWWEAFILQFSFLESYIRAGVVNFGKKLGLDKKTLKEVAEEQSVTRLISYFNIILISFIDNKSKKDFQKLILCLREHNLFRNDLLHNCANPKKFRGVIHIEQTLQEAYYEGEEILKLFTKVKIQKVNKKTDKKLEKLIEK